MTYRETLPASCPPSNSNHPKEASLWRLLCAVAPSKDDFDSQHHKNKTRKFKDQCGARAVSLVTSLEACRAAVKLPWMSAFTHAVEVKCCPTLGIWDNDKPTHVNWWPYKDVDPLKQLGSVRELD